MKTKMRELATVATCASTILGGVASVGWYANHSSNMSAAGRVERIDYCRGELPNSNAVNKALQYCLRTADNEEIGLKVSQEFALGAPIGEVTAYRNVQVTDSKDTDWLKNVLPGSGATLLVFAAVGYVACRPLRDE